MRRCILFCLLIVALACMVDSSAAAFEGFLPEERTIEIERDTAENDDAISCKDTEAVNKILKTKQCRLLVGTEICVSGDDWNSLVEHQCKESTDKSGKSVECRNANEWSALIVSKGCRPMQENESHIMCYYGKDWRTAFDFACTTTAADALRISCDSAVPFNNYYRVNKCRTIPAFIICAYNKDWSSILKYQCVPVDESIASVTCNSIKDWNSLLSSKGCKPIVAEEDAPRFNDKVFCYYGNDWKTVMKCK